MPSIKFIEFDGTEHQVEAEPGLTIKDAAINNLVPGIDADCGGECSCATCHVIFEADGFERVGPPSEREDSMLQLAHERAETSRLSCQIEVTEDMDGLIVKLPEFQS